MSVSDAGQKGLEILEEFAKPPWTYTDNGPNFVPYEVLTTTDTETLMRQLTLRSHAKVRVRGRDAPHQPWDAGIAMIDREAGGIAIKYKSGDSEILSLSKILINQKTNKHLIEFDGRGVVYALNLYEDAGMDGDWGYLAEDPEEFKRYIQELPTYLKYFGPRNTIGELEMLVSGMQFYWGGSDRSPPESP